MFGRNGFRRLMEFLIGQNATAAGIEQVRIDLFRSFVSYYVCTFLVGLLVIFLNI